MPGLSGPASIFETSHAVLGSGRFKLNGSPQPTLTRHHRLGDARHISANSSRLRAELRIEKLIGIITERHSRGRVRFSRAKRPLPRWLGKSWSETSSMCGPTNPWSVLCMALMTERRVRHLPVLEGDRVIGIVSIGDLLKSIISKQKFVIDELEHYIHG